MAKETTEKQPASVLKVKPVKITSIMLVCCGLLCVFFGIGFVIVRIRFQAYRLVFGYHIWCGVVIATAGALGIAAYKTLNRKIMIVAGTFAIISELTSFVLFDVSIWLLFEKVGRTAAWMAEPEAEARAEPETTGPTNSSAPEGEVTFSPIPAHKMDIFLQISIFLTIIYAVAGACGVVMGTLTLRAGCAKKKVEPEEAEKQPV